MFDKKNYDLAGETYNILQHSKGRTISIFSKATQTYDCLLLESQSQYYFWMSEVQVYTSYCKRFKF